MDTPQHEAHETTDHSNLTKIGLRLAVRTNRANVYNDIVYNDKAFILNGVKFTRLAHH